MAMVGMRVRLCRTVALKDLPISKITFGRPISIVPFIFILVKINLFWNKQDFNHTYFIYWLLNTMVVWCRFVMGNVVK